MLARAGCSRSHLNGYKRLLDQTYQFSLPQNHDDLEFVPIAMGITDLIHLKHDYIQGPGCTSLNNVEVWLPKTTLGRAAEGKWVV